MKRTVVLAVAVVAFGTGCGKDPRVDGLETRVAKLETDYGTLKSDHDKTRAKLQELLVWMNPKPSPDKNGLADWIGFVHAKTWPAGPGDPVKPGKVPDPF